MTEQLREMSARIAGIQQLGTVVNAMRGIAGNRAQRARSALVAVDAYSATLGKTIGRALALQDDGRATPARGADEAILVLFTAEQGFAGAFSERVLDDVVADAGRSTCLVVGTRGATIARERGILPNWTAPMPSHVDGVPRLAQNIAEALFARMAGRHVACIEAVFTTIPEHIPIVRRLLLMPLDERSFPRAAGANPPLVNLPAPELLARLASDYLHAQLCHAALHAFAAENAARMQAMASAHREIDQRLAAMGQQARILRQDEITAEIIELTADIQAVTKPPGR